MRDYLIAHLKELINKDQIRPEEAEELMIQFDVEVEWKNKSEQHAFDKAQQDIALILNGEWGE